MKHASVKFPEIFFEIFLFFQNFFKFFLEFLKFIL